MPTRPGNPPVIGQPPAAPAPAPTPTLKDVFGRPIGGGATTQYGSGGTFGNGGYTSGPAYNVPPGPHEQPIDTSKLLDSWKGQYETLVSPQIQNQLSLMGLGHSTNMANALAMGGAQMYPQLAQAQLDAQEQAAQRANAERIARIGAQSATGTAGINASTQRYLGDLGARQAGISQLINLGNAFNQQGGQGIDALLQTGGLQQGQSQNQMDAYFNDFLRRAGAAQFATGTPFAGAGSMIGSTTHGKG